MSRGESSRVRGVWIVRLHVHTQRAAALILYDYNLAWLPVPLRQNHAPYTMANVFFLISNTVIRLLPGSQDDSQARAVIEAGQRRRNS
jgi:hypothetical protein